jgi:cytochrome P450
LSKYPGPFLWTISRIPFALSLQQGNLVHDTKRFHDQYGTIVRLAPNEISFIEPEALQDIYGHRKKGHKEFRKNPIWTPSSPNGAHSLINALEKDHPRMRKPLVPAFSMKALREQKNTIHHYIDLLIYQLRSKCADGQGAAVAMRDYHDWTTFDILVSI